MDDGNVLKNNIRKECIHKKVCVVFIGHEMGESISDPRVHPL